MPLFNQKFAPARTLVPPKERPQKRYQAEYSVTLVSLNNTFPKKHIHVPFFPETCKLGRPAGTKVKSSTNNGYFNLRVLSRNHACMFINPKSGELMVQDMGLSNGTFVNQEKILLEPVAVGVGDIINLGFNIQVETSHKQISARIENINVVSNDPKGPILQVLPGLTKHIMSNFSDAEMRHYDFIQGLLGQLLDEARLEQEQPDPAAAALQVFDNAVFSDIIASADTFDPLATPKDNAGIYDNSNITNTKELLSTMDFLNVNLARIKQQNKSLRSMEVFLSNYADKVTELNTKCIELEIRKHDEKLEGLLQVERNKHAEKIGAQEAKILEQARLIASLEDEIAKLKLDQHTLTEKLIQLENDANTTDNELSFVNEFDALDLEAPSQEIAPTHLPAPAPAMAGLDLVRSRGSVEAAPLSPSPSRPHLSQTSHDATPRLSFLDSMHEYKNHGVMVGFLVVVAGFLYQNTR